MIAKVVILCIILSATHAVTYITVPIYTTNYGARPVHKDDSGRYYFGELPSEGEGLANSVYGGPQSLGSAGNAFGLTYAANANQPGLLLGNSANTAIASPYASSASPATTSTVSGASAALISTPADQTVVPRAPFVPQITTINSAPPASVSPPASQTVAPRAPFVPQTAAVSGAPSATVSTPSGQTVASRAPYVPQTDSSNSPSFPAFNQIQAPVASLNNAFGSGLVSRLTPSAPVSPYTNFRQQGAFLSSPYRPNLHSSGNTRSLFL